MLCSRMQLSKELCAGDDMWMILFDMKYLTDPRYKRMKRTIGPSPAVRRISLVLEVSLFRVVAYSNFQTIDIVIRIPQRFVRKRRETEGKPCQG